MKRRERFTICLIANAAGGKEVASVIWKSKNLDALKVLMYLSFQLSTFAQVMHGSGEILASYLLK